MQVVGNWCYSIAKQGNCGVVFFCFVEFATFVDILIFPNVLDSIAVEQKILGACRVSHDLDYIVRVESGGNDVGRGEGQAKVV